jgi:hypothetical protein
MAHTRRRIGRLGVRKLLVAAERCRVIRRRRDHAESEQASQRPEALVHPVILRDATTGEIARSMPLELPGG